jgi:pyridoxal phosphate enzyme (YggS family)
VEPLAANLARVRAALDAAAARSGRDPQSVHLIAITKTVPLERIRAAMALGIGDFGENRMQEALPKVRALAEARWHFVGHLQTNKARELRQGFHCLHSLDSHRLAEAVAAQGVTGLDVLLEVNVAGESQKFGFAPAALRDEFPALLRLGLRLRGLMTIAPLAAKAEAARPHFRALRRLRDELAKRFATPLPELSMGMSDDYQVAVEEGATMVRLGRALFADRRDSVIQNPHIHA